MDRKPRATRPKSARGGGPWWPLALGLLTLAGCSQPGPFTRRTGMVGALKTNVAQLESEKDALARQLAELKAENRRVDAQLADVESQNGDLAARLDDARAVMSRQGIDEGRTAASRPAADGATPRRSNTVKVQPKGRKTPFAQIPSDRRDLDEQDESSRDDLRDPRSSRDDQSRLDDRSPWLPVARGRDAATRYR